MATLTIPYDHSRDPMNPDDLSDRIAAALGVTTAPVVDIDPVSITVTDPSVDESKLTQVQAVIAAYVFDPARSKTGSGIAGRLRYQAQQAIQTNIDALALPDPTAANTAYLGHAAIPAGTLTAAQLSTIVRTLSDQVDALTRQNNALVAQARALTRQNTALIRLLLGATDSLDGTTGLRS